MPIDQGESLSMDVGKSSDAWPAEDLATYRRSLSSPGILKSTKSWNIMSYSMARGRAHGDGL